MPADIDAAGLVMVDALLSLEPTQYLGIIGGMFLFCVLILLGALLRS